ncbi:MAG: hypothetical protein ACLFVU_06165 [Phycisphaerae bacterium]
MSLLTLALSILLVFYLFVSFRFSVVRRPLFYMIGALMLAAGLAICIFFAAWVPRTWARVLVSIVGAVSVLASLACAVLSTYTGKLPETCEKTGRTEPATAEPAGDHPSGEAQ